jgi:hypothetical protein
MPRFDFIARWILPPALYAASVPSVFVVGMLLIATLVEQTLGYVWVLATLLALLEISALVIGQLSIGLVCLEHMRPQISSTACGSARCSTPDWYSWAPT